MNDKNKFTFLDMFYKFIQQRTNEQKMWNDQFSNEKNMVIALTRPLSLRQEIPCISFQQN